MRSTKDLSRSGATASDIFGAPHSPAPTNAFFVGFGETTIKVTIGIDHAGGRESSGGSDASRTPELPRSTAHSLGRRIVPPEEPGSAWQEPGDVALYQGLVQPLQLPQPASETASPMRASPPHNLRAKPSGRALKALAAAVSPASDIKKSLQLAPNGASSLSAKAPSAKAFSAKPSIAWQRRWKRPCEEVARRSTQKSAS
jgi:hypothetical protein